MNWTIVLTVLAIGGAVANAFQKWWGFVLWICANTGWIVYELSIGELSQVPMWIVYDIISAIGIVAWLKNKRK